LTESIYLLVRCIWPKDIIKEGVFSGMKSRELNRVDCAALLSAGKYGRLGLSLNDLPYVIPISYVYFDNKIYLHSRGGGRKIDLVSKNPSVCFQIDQLDEKCWSSVVAYGKARLSSDVEAKRRMFDVFIQKGLGGHGGKKFDRDELENMEMTIWEIEVEEMTGREGIW
jgi:nitroimidazol reductase NimA-like FMN-containing flavoprotein (pyridoxamine 5'-phosphate oxidase superfamily)